jgi:hypothetical protein
MTISETIISLKAHFKEQFLVKKENIKIFYFNHKFYVQAEKEAALEVKEKHANKPEYERYVIEYRLKEAKINAAAPLMKQYSVIPTDDNLTLTLKHILYNRLRNKTRGHTHDDQQFIDKNKGRMQFICKGMEVQQDILELGWRERLIAAREANANCN